MRLLLCCLVDLVGSGVNNSFGVDVTERVLANQTAQIVKIWQVCSHVFVIDGMPYSVFSLGGAPHWLLRWGSAAGSAPVRKNVLD
jgi:hypothetical protein